MIESAAVSVGTSPTALNAAEGTGSDPISLVLSNVGAVTVYLGGSDVTTATGVPLAAGADRAVSLETGEILYGRVAAATAEVRVLRLGVG